MSSDYEPDHENNRLVGIRKLHENKAATEEGQITSVKETKENAVETMSNKGSSIDTLCPDFLTESVSRHQMPWPVLVEIWSGSLFGSI